MTSRHQCDKTEHNFVADAQNWESRVKGETDAARAWHANWGSLFAPNEPRSFSDKIALLQKQAEKLPVQAMMSNTQMSFTEVKPYKEYSSKSHKRRSAWDDEAL